MVATDIRCNSGETVGKSLSNLLWFSIMPSSCLFLRNIGLASFVLLFRKGRNKKYKKIQNTIIAPVWKEVDYSDQLVSQFLDWTNTNGMSCNPSKCKELTIKKRGNRDLYSPIGMIPSCKKVEILGVTFQCDSKFSVHVKNKLIKANKSLHILRTLRKEGYNQSEIDLLFNTIVLPNINYALSVYASSESDLTPVQCFLDRCFKRKYTSKPVSDYDFFKARP